MRKKCVIFYLGRVPSFFFILKRDFHYVGMTDQENNTSLALRGLEELFPVVLLCQFFVLVGNRFWFYILLMLLEYHTVVVLC